MLESVLLGKGSLVVERTTMETEWEIMENRLRILFAYKENERTDKRVTKFLHLS